MEAPDPRTAKWLGRGALTRIDWERVKVEAMLLTLIAKCDTASSMLRESLNASETPGIRFDAWWGVHEARRVSGGERAWEVAGEFARAGVPAQFARRSRVPPARRADRTTGFRDGPPRMSLALLAIVALAVAYLSGSLIIGFVAVAVLLALGAIVGALADADLHGKAYVTDGDGIRVNGVEVRLAGLDAPEHDQYAVLQNGKAIDHGRIVKSALVRKIGGCVVYVSVEGQDKFGRRIGTVTCEGKDINRWLVEEGHAIAAHGNQYRDAEAHARRERKGMWRYREAYHPAAWRFGKRKLLK